MSVNLTINGQTFAYPEVGDTDWGTSATLWATAATNGMLQKAGGTFTLLADVNFGATFGIVSAYYKSTTSNISTAGSIRLAQADTIGWRNAANDNDLLLSVSSDALRFNGTNVIISGSIVNADISASAAIAFSKLASLTSGFIILGNGSNVPTATQVTGDISIDDVGVTSISNGAIVNADVNASAAIAYSKLNLATSIVNADISGSAAISFSKLSGVVGTTTAQSVAGVKTFTDNVLIDNEKELRLYEATGSGSNYLGFKAPSAVTSNTTFTLPNGDGTSNQVLQTNGSGTLGWATVAAGIGTNFDVHTVTSADYTILDADGYRHILVSTGASNRIITLPSAAANTDRLLTIKKTDSGAGLVTVTRAGSSTIDGATTFVLTNQYEKVTIVCNGTDWFVEEGSLATVSMVGLVKKNKFQRKNLSASNSGTVTFNNLTSGQVYRLSILAEIVTTTTANSQGFVTASDANVAGSGQELVYFNATSASQAGVVVSSFSQLYTSSLTALTLTTGLLNGASLANGFATLEEVNDAVVTTDFT
jgi:hypothetical protein